MERGLHICGPDGCRFIPEETNVYDYKKEKPKLFTEEGSVKFNEVRDRVRRLLPTTGAITMGAASRIAGDSWMALACVDRLVELEELTEVVQVGKVFGQDRVFVTGPKWA